MRKHNGTKHHRTKRNRTKRNKKYQKIMGGAGATANYSTSGHIFHDLRNINLDDFKTNIDEIKKLANDIFENDGMKHYHTTDGSKGPTTYFYEDFMLDKIKELSRIIKGSEIGKLVQLNKELDDFIKSKDPPYVEKAVNRKPNESPKSMLSYLSIGSG